MKRLTTTILFLTFAICSFSQSDFESLMKQGKASSDQGKYLLAVLRYKKASALQPLNEVPHIKLSWNYLLLNNTNEAQKFARKAYYLNQSNASCYSILSYAYKLSNEQGADELLKTAIGMSNQEDQQYYLEDLQKLLQAEFTEEFFTEQQIEQFFIEKNNWESDASWLFESIGLYYSSDRSMNEILSRLNTSTIPDTFKAYYIMHFSNSLVGSGYHEPAQALIKLGRALRLSDGMSAKYVQTNMVAALMRIANSVGNYEQAIKYYNEIDNQNWAGLDYMNLTHPLYECYLLASQAYNALGTIELQEEVARKLIAASDTYQNSWYHVNGFNSLGTVKLNSSLSSDRSAAKGSLETALNLAQNNNFESLIPSIVSNLAISYWQHGMQDEAKKAYIKLSNDALARENYLSAELYLNNLASMYFYNEDYRKAATYFQQSIDLIEEHRDKVADGSKITFLQARQSSYTFLSSCLIKLGDKTGLFKIQEAQRARILAEQLQDGKPNNSMSLQTFQQLLSADQAAIYYTLMEAGSVVIHVVTNTDSYAIRHEAFDEFIAFKNKYLARMKSSYSSRAGFKPAIASRVEGGVQIQESDKARLLNKDDFEMMVEFSRELLQDENEVYNPIRKDFLVMLYKLLLAPIQNQIHSKKKLLISPDGLLNFIPFETLINAQGRYLVQSHEVSYIQSASVYNTLIERKYTSDRKGMIAFGGAIYEKMDIQSEPIRGANRLNDIQLNVGEKIKSGGSLRSEYAAIGFGKMNYLPGTLAEVNSMSTIVPNSKVYRGAEFDESFIKRLSSEGSLSDYKVVHFATHGFSIPMVPELSGIATCIYAKEKNGEDGYLNVREMSQLDLNADLAVLSACETGLGKIYGGEGVFGLTQSLLVAGANEAAVSLWPVSDQGTMYFMKGMYELVVNDQLTYSEAMTEMKRKFIAGQFGQQFTHPNYWAPFIHYGKTETNNMSEAVASIPLAKPNTPSTPLPANTIELHEDGIRRMIISPNKKLIATGGEKRVIVWDANTLVPIKDFTFADGLHGLHFNENSSAVFTYSSYNELVKHNLSTGNSVKILPKGRGNVTTTREWKEGKAISVFKNHIIEFIDLETGTLISKMDFGESGYVADFILLPEQDRFILSFITWGHKADRIEVYQMSTKKLLNSIESEAVDIYYDEGENAVFAVKARGTYSLKKVDLETSETRNLEVARGSLLVLIGNGKFITNKNTMINEAGLHQIHDIKSGVKLDEIELKGFEHPKQMITEGQLLMMDGSGRLRILDTTIGKLIK